MAGWWEDYKKRRGLSSGGSESRTGKTYTERITTDEHRQAAKSSTWWEDYKKKNNLERRAADDRQRAAYMEKKRARDQQSYMQYTAAQRQLEENRSRDAAEDEIRELFRNPFSSDAEWQAGVWQRTADRYQRDLPLYQQSLEASSYSRRLNELSRNQALVAQREAKNQFERYQQAAQNAEQDRNESNLVNRPAQWQAENLTPQEIEQRLAYYRSEAATPTVTDRDREEHAYLYPEAALQKVPHGARFDERLLEGAGQDAIDALYRPILTEQEKAAVEEADRKIIEEKSERNYENVQRLLAAQAGQTEMFSRARGNELIEEIAQGGEAANRAKTGKALFDQQQARIAADTAVEIKDDLESSRGAYTASQKERQRRGYILGYDWDNVPEDRKQAVYALFTESPEKAIELAKFYIADVRQAEDEERQAWYAQSGWTAALGLVSSAAAHLGSAVDPFGEVGQELTRRGDNALAGGSQWADAATGYQKIPEWVPVVGGKGAGDLYQTVGSVVQSAAVAAPAILAGRYDQAAAEVLSKLGLVLMGSSAAASDYRESVAAGMDEDRAKLHALAAGVEEALFEEVSLDKLIKMDTSGGLKAALKNWLVQSGVEGSEELATSIANRFTDEMISGAGQSEVERRASELIANGMNSTEAHTQAESEWMTDTLYEGFSGFLSGGMMTGGDYALQGAANLTERAVNAVETRKAQKQAGAAVSRSEGSVEAIQAYAKDKGIEIKGVETAEQNTGESTEQGEQGATKNSYSNRDYRSISDTNSKVVQSIRNDLRGKTVQEQQTIRDNLVEKYGEGIAPVVNQAISVETAARVRQEYGSVDSIQSARNQAVSEIKDESLRRAVSDGYDSAAYSLAASQGGEGGMNAMSRYIQQRRNTGSGSEMSMNATVTAQDGSTKTIAITGMSEDGKRVSLADGSEVAVKDIQADADTTSAIQQLADLDLGDDATKVLQAYQQSGISGTEGYRWLMDYATAYNQGRTRQISLEQAAQRSSLDERTVMNAYTLGQQAANRETQAGLEKLKNLPKRKGASGRTANIDTTEIKGKTMSKSELEQFELANQYAQALGVDMKWFSSKEKDGKFVGKNGAYENGKIYMDIHAGRNFAADLTSGILATMGHELSHFEQQYAPEEYQALKEFLFEQIVKSSPNGEARLERLIWEKQRRSGYTLSRKAAEDEVVADACQKMLRDSKAVHDFANQQPEAANGVIRWLDKWFKKVRSIFGRGGNYSEEAQLMDSLEQDVKAAFGELWDKALKQAVEVHDRVGNIQKAVAIEANEIGASEQMVEDAFTQHSDRIVAKTLEGENVSVPSNVVTPGLLKALRAEGVRIEEKSTSRKSAAQNSDREDQSLRWLVSELEDQLDMAELNGLSQAEIRKLNNELIKARGQLDNYTTNQRRQAKKTSFNEILRNLENYERIDLESLAEQISDSAWDDYDELSDEELIDALRETINERLDDFAPGDADNPKYGLFVKKPKATGNISVVRNSDRDVEYLELAKDPEKNAARLQEMVDEAAESAGYTIKAYHGTTENFTQFSQEKQGQNHKGYLEFGAGFYFTPSEKEARNWAERGKNGPARAKDSKVMAVYLNPGRIIEADNTIPGGKKYLEGMGLTEEDASFVANRAYRFINYLLEDKGYSNVEVQDQLKAMGFDAVEDTYRNRTEGQYVVFAPEQVKSADPVTYDDSGNVIPLSERFRTDRTGVEAWKNRDIRYSERDDVQTEDQLRDQISAAQKEFYEARDQYQQYSFSEEHDKLLDALTRKEEGSVERYAEWMKQSGYEDAYNRMNAAEKRMNDGRKELDRLIDQRLEREEQDAIRKSGLTEQDYFRKQAIKEFGYTPYFYDAGYILPNGKLLNFSGEKGRHFGTRGEDHRAIGQIYASSSGSAAMIRFMNQGNVRIMAESPGIDISNATPLTKEQYATIRRFVNEVRSDKYFNLDFSDERGNNIGSIEYEGRFTADRVLNDIRNFFDTGEVRQPSGLSAFYSERDYSTPSDEELLMQAKVEDAANAEQGRELKDYQALGKRIATLEKQLAEAKRQTQLTNRALNTRGIGNVVKTVMRDYDITDARHNGTAKNATQALTDGYQKALDLLDKGASPAEVNDAVYNGAVKAAEIILEQGTYSQNLGGKWQTYSASRYLGENSQELIDSFVSEAYADFVSNRYREARPETAADRLVARTKKEAQERVDKYKGRGDALAEANRRLEEKTKQAESEAKEARKAAGELFLEIKDLRQELIDNKTMSEQERKAANKKLKALNKSLEAKREEAASWQKRAKRNASLLKSALESKNRDISALEKKIQRYRDILAGKANSPELAKLLKAEREWTEARVKEQKEQVFQNYKERKKATDLRGRIKNLSDEMKRRMTNPTDRAYVPASLYQSMTKLADVLDNVLSPNPGTKAEARYRAMMDAIRGMAREYEDVKKLDPVFASEYDQEVIDAIGEIERILERKNASWIDGLAGDTQKSFAELNSDELQQLYELMQQINYTITNATKVFGNLRYESIREAIASGLEQQSKITPINDVSKKERNKRLSVMNKRSPMRAVEFMSNMDRSAALYEAFQQVEAGDEQRLAWSLAYQNDFRELKSGKNEKEYWQSLTKQIDYGATDKKTGKPVTMTKMQAIQLFMTAQREAANKDLEHLFKGGTTIRNAKDIMEGKENIRSNEIFVTPELLKNIENSFTEWDRQYMARMRDYLKREGKAVNKVFYKLKHRVLALEENYVPTIVDQKYLDAKLETTDFSGLFVKSPRSTQAITKGAPQPLIIDGMETMMNKHVQEQAQYIGMATAIRDFAKIFNGKVSTSENGVGYTSLKAEIERNFGKKGVHLITQALIDIQGGSTQSGWRSGLEKVIKKLQTSFVRHALLFNLSVTIKQAASYVAAGSIISREALLKGNRSILNKNEASHSASLITQIFLNPNGKTAQKIFARADKYTALHADRRNGMNFAEVELGQKNYGKLRQKAAEIGANLEQKRGGHKVREIGAALNPASWIQRMDVATTAALFVACEYQARMDGLEGEAYHAKVKELYERVLRETQPMYDSLHRTAQQKSGGSLAQYLFPFRTVPIQNHGQMASAYDRLLAAKTKSNTEKAEAAKFFRKTLIAQIESAVVFSAMTFAAALTKRKTKKYRDEDGELTLESVARGFGLDVASTLVSVASPMWGSELWSLSDRFINKLTGKGGYTYDSFSVGALDMINDTAAAIDKIAADVGKAMRREDVSLKEFGSHMFSLLTKVGNLSGIPADTIKTYTEGFIGNIQDAIEGRIPALNDESWERDAATNARRYLKAYMDNDTKKASAVLAELRSTLSRSGKDEEKINEAIRKAVSAQAVEKVADGTWTEEEAEAYLLSTGAYDDRENPQKDAWNAIRKGVAKSTSTDEEFNWKQYDELAEAVANGEDITSLLAEYRNHGYSDDQINAAIRSGIQEALTAGDLDGNEAADALIRYGVTYSKNGKDVVYDEQTAWKKVQEWADKAEHTDEEGELEDGYKYSAYTDLFDAVDANQNADGVIQTMVKNGGYDTDSLRGKIKEHLLERFIAGQITETALKNQLSRYCKIVNSDDANEIVANAKCKRDFGVYPDDLKEAFKDGDLSQNQAEKALQQYKGLSKTDAQNRVQYWGYDGDLSENAWTKWAHELKSTGLSVDNWEKVYKVKSSAKGTDANGDGRADSGTVKAEVVSYIDSMNIPKSQKKAIYLAFGWAASTMPSWR